MTTLKLACLQANTGNDLAANLTAATSMVRAAAANGAKFVFTPEYTLMMDGSGRVMREQALPADGGAPLVELRALAKELGIWLLLGSLTLRTQEERMANRSFLINDGGEVVATYDKIHMFDITLPDGKVIRESSAYRPGDKAVVADTPWGKLGMTICYDLRFPALFRTLAQAGAQIITVPSSFQRQTGKAHWQVLLQARAIENGCYIVAPAMCGDHAGNRQTFGPGRIDQCTARVARIDGRVGLDKVLEGVDPEPLPARGTDDPLRDRLSDAERVADGEHHVAYLQRFRIPEGDWAQTIGRNPQNRQVCFRIGTHHLCLRDPAITEDDRDLVGTFDNVIVGQNITRVADHYAGAEAGRCFILLAIKERESRVRDLPAHRLGGIDVDHRRYRFLHRCPEALGMWCGNRQRLAFLTYGDDLGRGRPQFRGHSLPRQ